MRVVVGASLSDITPAGLGTVSGLEVRKSACAGAPLRRDNIRT
jgi:hypothetical protein